MTGTLLATGVFFLGFVIFAGLEFVDNFRYRLWCQATETLCPPSDPSDFTKIVAYGVVAMCQVMILFLVSLGIERRLRNSEYDPAWR
jgi:hypothetical protein